MKSPKLRGWGIDAEPERTCAFSWTGDPSGRLKAIPRILFEGPRGKHSGSRCLSPLSNSALPLPCCPRQNEGLAEVLRTMMSTISCFYRKQSETSFLGDLSLALHRDAQRLSSSAPSVSQRQRRDGVCDTRSGSLPLGPCHMLVC